MTSKLPRNVGRHKLPSDYQIEFLRSHDIKLKSIPNLIHGVTYIGPNTVATYSRTWHLPNNSQIQPAPDHESTCDKLTRKLHHAGGRAGRRAGTQ